MMALPPFGVILSQYPIGWVSDRIDRRTIILLLAVASSLIATIILAGGYYVTWFMLIALMTMFGIVSLPIYSLVIAHANDHLRKEQVLGASAKLVLLYGAGSIVGPILAGYLMSDIGRDGFLIYMIAVHGLLGAFAAWRYWRRPDHAKAHGRDVMSVSPVSTPANVPLLQD
jgi:MFS family permease